MHFYEGYDLDLAIRSSWINLLRAGLEASRQCWCLASPPGICGLDALSTSDASHRISRFKDSDGLEQAAIETGEGTIIIVPGTQAISREGLEVLSLGAVLAPSEPLGLIELVDLVRTGGGIAVVPWGVGKWLGRRAALISSLLKLSSAQKFLVLADNANRPFWWRYPSLLSRAQREGFVVISGSDPLPIAGDEERIGSAGVILATRSTDVGWSQIRNGLMASRDEPLEIFGAPMSNARFWKNQLRLRVRPTNS